MAKKSVALSYLELDELVTRVLCDTAPPDKVDAAYLFGETEDNEASVLKAAVFLYGMGPAEGIAICTLNGGCGYKGFENWEKKLVKEGIPKRDIYLVPLAGEFPPSTHAEAFGLVRFAEKMGLRSVYVVAPPLHQLRAFTTTVSAILKEKSKLLAYSFPGIAQSWEEHVVHSQGIQRGTRSWLLGAELKKIESYYRRGDLVSAEEVLKYLEKRDRKSKT